MPIDLVSVLKHVPNILGLTSLVISKIQRMQYRKNLEKTILCLRNIHFSKGGSSRIIEKATKVELTQDDISDIRMHIKYTANNVQNATQVLNEYGNRPDHYWKTRDRIEGIRVGKTTLTAFVERVLENPQRLSVAQLQEGLRAISEFNRQLENFHDELVKELKSLNDKK